MGTGRTDNADDALSPARQALGKDSGGRTPVPLADLAMFLDGLLVADRFRGLDDPVGVWRPSERPVTAVGLLLEPWAGLPAWAAAHRLDALIVHRPWDLPADVPALSGVGVLAYHLAFDERLTLGYNPRLAESLGLTDLEVLGRKAGRPLGMVGDLAPDDGLRFLGRLAAAFGGLDEVAGDPDRLVARVAVVGAMSERLLREAAARGADAYVTGQYRRHAQAAVDETGLLVVAAGHARSERWGLAALGDALAGRWPTLRVVTPPR